MVEPIDIRTGKPFVSRRCHEHHLPPSDGASLGGAMGRARGLLGGCFTGCLMAQNHSKIPAGCTRIAYLGSTGTQYIYVPFMPNTETYGFEVEFMDFSNIPSSLIGARHGTTRGGIIFHQSELNWKPSIPIGSNNGIATPFKTSITEGTIKFQIDSINRGSLWENGTRIKDNVYFTGSYQSNSRFALFGDSFGSYVDELSTVKIKWVKFWHGTDPANLSLDLVPVKRTESGVEVGYMCDLLTGNLYGNNGTGLFVLGTPV